VANVALLNRNPADKLRFGIPTNPTAPGVAASPTFKNAKGPRRSGVAASTLPQYIEAMLRDAPRPATAEKRNRPADHDARSSASDTSSLLVVPGSLGTVSTLTIAPESARTAFAMVVVVAD
jgi:hypothetical protein